MSALTKRQRERNEKILHELLHSVPGNNNCADCHAQNPAWASWSLGIFLCMRCAAIHRKLGTHISKVKSLSMDSWSNEQVENMRKVGNASSNKTYNPQNKKPPVPVDADEADGAMERFIRSKYMNRALAATGKHNTGSTESDETPPPLPPKTPGRFGIRSASSIFPLGSKSKKKDGPGSPPEPGLRRNKPSQTFGASISYDNNDGDDTQRKLAKLRDMGFTDDQRNALVLKGVGGNLEKTIEALVRLGEGDSRTLTRSPNASLVPSRGSSLPTNRSLTPNTDTSRPLPTTPASSNNPFDALDAPQFPQPLSSQSTGTLQNKNPYLNNTNPFGLPTMPQSAGLEQTFSNLSLAPPSQPLFPNHTGGMQQPPQNPYQQSMTPPVSASHNYGAMAYNSSQTYPIPTQQTGNGYNPFLTTQQVQQPQQMQQPLSVNTGLPANYGNNPFTRSPTRIQSPTLTQIPEQMQSSFYPQAQAPQFTGNNPFLSQPAQQQQQQQPYQQQQQFYQQPGQTQMQQLGLPTQHTGYATWSAPQRANKASIMALFDYPPPQQQQAQPQAQAQPQPQTASNPFQVQNQPAQGGYTTSNNPFPTSNSMQQQVQQPAPVSQMAGSKNPFANSGQQQPQQQATASLIDTSVSKQKPYNVSRESMMAVGLEWTNGRHSPDAFASLSASHAMR
ncbi:UBA domain containing protein [Naviculisporaceae sp. PSN 640]